MKKFAVWFKNYAGKWTKWGVIFNTKKEAERGLKYVKKQFALNGQAGIFEAI